MTSNHICIDSPFFRVPPPFHSQHRPEPEPEPEDAQVPFFRFMLTSPEILPPAFRPPSSLPLTPWAVLGGDREARPVELTLPSLLFSEGQREEAIDDRIIYSDAEEECDLMTPVKLQGSQNDELSSLELLTTGRKGMADPLQTSKPSRQGKIGLRLLTQRAYQIVQSLRNATYKDVADRLVREIKQEDAGFESETREEQNIKRRVYDALNVLIAVGLLKKEGRRVCSNERNKGRKNYTSNKMQREEIEMLSILVEKKQQRVVERRQKLKETESKLEVIRQLLTRNKEKYHNKESIVCFPFIGLAPSVAKVRIEQSNRQSIEIHSSDNFELYGDIDCLKWINKKSNQREDGLNK